jgi:hypothetical protein
MSQPPDILKTILRRKTEELVERSRSVPIRQMSQRAAEQSPVRGFYKKSPAATKPLVPQRCPF